MWRLDYFDLHPKGAKYARPALENTHVSRVTRGHVTRGHNRSIDFQLVEKEG
jgi:hypothetical protein